MALATINNGQTGAVVRGAINTNFSIMANRAPALTPEEFGAVGDGVTDDYTAMQAAITAAIAAKVPLQLKGVTYLIGTTLLCTSNFTLLGEFGSSQLKAASSLADGTSLLQTTTVAGVFNSFEYSNIMIRDVIFNGNNRTMTNYRGLVRFSKTDNLHIEGCTFMDHKYILLSLLGCQRFTIVRNTFTTWGKSDVSVEGGAGLYIGQHSDTDQTTSKLGSVERNYFAGGEWAAWYGVGQWIDYCYNSVFQTKEGIYTRNYDTSGGDSGIGDRNCMIIGNKISGVTRKYIQAAGMEVGGWNLTIMHNTVTDCEHSGILLTDVSRNVTVAYNQVSDTCKDTVTYPTSGQIAARSTTVTDIRPTNIDISHNRVGDEAITPLAPYGILIQELGSGQLVDPLILKNNNVLNGAASSANNLFVQSAAYGDNTIVEGNMGHKSAYPQVRRQQLTATTGNVSITGIGFKPRVVTIDAVVPSSTAANRSFGLRTRDGGGSFCNYTHASTGFHGGSVDTAIIKLVTAAAANTFLATLSSFDPDGFTLNVTVGGTAPLCVFTCYP